MIGYNLAGCKFIRQRQVSEIEFRDFKPLQEEHQESQKRKK
jgi:hypothetical protein